MTDDLTTFIPTTSTRDKGKGGLVSVLDHHPMPTAICDENGFIYYCNRAFAMLVGGPGGNFQVRFGLDFPAQNWDGVLVEHPAHLRVMDDGQWLLTLSDDRQAVNLRARLIEAEQARGKFLSTANHDLRQPIQALLMYASVLEDRAADDDGIRKIAQRMQESAQSIDMLLTSLVFTARLDAEIVPPFISQFALKGPLGRAIDAVRPEAEAKGVRLEYVPTRHQTETDPDLLEKLLLELLRNAIRYTPKGKVLVGCRIVADQVVVQIWDQGIGVPHDEMSLIFNDFYQIDNVARDRRRGLGLGLGIVRRLCSLLGLELDFASQIGRGTLVQLTLPLRTPLALAPRQLPLQLLSRGADIWLIDDDEDIINSLCMVLESWGHRVRGATSPDLFLAAPNGLEPPDLVICDNRMPGWTGVKALEAIHSRFGAVPGVILTGDTAPETLAYLSAKGFGILHKPIDADQLRIEMERIWTDWTQKTRSKAKIRKRTCRAKPLQDQLF